VLSRRGLCDELITRQQKSYRLWCVVVCDLETSWMRRPWPTGGCCTTKKIDSWHLESMPNAFCNVRCLCKSHSAKRKCLLTSRLMLKSDGDWNCDILSCDEARKFGIEIQCFGEEALKRWIFRTAAIVLTMSFLYNPPTELSRVYLEGTTSQNGRAVWRKFRKECPKETTPTVRQQCVRSFRSHHFR